MSGTGAPGWFDEEGPDSDVAASSRVRLARCLRGFAFPSAADEVQRIASREAMLEALRPLAPGFKLSLRTVEATGAARLKALVERGVMSPSFSQDGRNCFAAAEASELSVLVNDVDHLRMSAFQSGLQLNHCHKMAETLEIALGESLEYAAAVEAGFLCTQLSDMGTGLKATVLLHLPALVDSGFLDRALKAVLGMGYSVKGVYGGEGGDSLGSFYQLSSSAAIGSSEQEMLLVMDKTVRQIAEFERRAREEVRQQRAIELEDLAFRALGLARSCRLLGQQEAVELLSRIRYGAAAGILPREMIKAADALVYRTQRGHLAQALDVGLDEADTVIMDRERARLVAEALSE